jgi:hypothetical protein
MRSFLFLYDHETSGSSSSLCFGLYRCRCFRPEEFVSEFPSPRQTSSSGTYHLYLSVSADLTGSKTTAGLALRVIGIHKTLLHGKVVIRMVRNFLYRILKDNKLRCLFVGNTCTRRGRKVKIQTY